MAENVPKPPGVMLAELWAAKPIEWRRIVALLQASGQESYDPAQDAWGGLGQRAGGETAGGPSAGTPRG
ncbi:hypothetical protein C1703_38325 [Streptomyces sp. Go-475]|nr:hypothetical protein C1703_38325 [Streptomyces sp. Go-475]